MPLNNRGYSRDMIHNHRGSGLSALEVLSQGERVALSCFHLFMA